MHNIYASKQPNQHNVLLKRRFGKKMKKTVGFQVPKKIKSEIKKKNFQTKNMTSENFVQLRTMFPQYDESEIRRIVDHTSNMGTAIEMVLDNTDTLKLHQTPESRKNADFAVASMEQKVSSFMDTEELSRIKQKCTQNSSVSSINCRDEKQEEKKPSIDVFGKMSG